MARHEELSIGELTLTGTSNNTVTVMSRDANRDVSSAETTSIPADASSGYAVGCELILTDAVLGMAARWVNVGSITSSKFRPYGPRVGPSILKLVEAISAGGDTTETITIQGIRVTTDISMVGHIVSNDTDEIESQIITQNTVTIVASADPVSTEHQYAAAIVRSGIEPEWDIFAAATYDSVGGNVAEAITVAGVLATDVAFACHAEAIDNDAIGKVVCTANTVTITSDADPVTAHAWHYVVMRPRGTFVPSHYIAYAGIVTSGSGDNGGETEAFTIAGILATDVAMVTFAATDDNDTIEQTVLTADTMTITLSADPGTAHKLAYWIMRAY